MTWPADPRVGRSRPQVTGGPREMAAPGLRSGTEPGLQACSPSSFAPSRSLTDRSPGRVQPVSPDRKHRFAPLPSGNVAPAARGSLEPLP